MRKTILAIAAAVALATASAGGAMAAHGGGGPHASYGGWGWPYYDFWSCYGAYGGWGYGSWGYGSWGCGGWVRPSSPSFPAERRRSQLIR
jgi:hypothetical protein